MPRAARLNQEIKAAGAWVFSRRAARAEHGHGRCGQRGDDVVMTDGPYVEGKEHVGGFWIVSAPDLDAALGWARKAARTTRCRSRCGRSRAAREY